LTTKAPHTANAEHQEILDRLKRWIDKDVALELARTGQFKIEINVKGTDIRANVTGFYQVN